MNIKVVLISFVCVCLGFDAMSSIGRDRVSALRDSLERYVSDADAKIGIAIVANGKDTVVVNGSKSYPMLSVYKFPQALAVADYCDRHNIGFADSISIAKSEIKTDTYSPLREKYGCRDISLSIGELLMYTLQLSDNNACDILFRIIGGPQVVDDYISMLGIPGISVVSTEDEMHADTQLCYENNATPIAMAKLLEKFDTELRHSSRNMATVAHLLEACSTGLDRLAASLPDDAILGHKTGTGDMNEEGRIIAVNDVGYLHTADGQRYTIVVFVSDSAYDMQGTSAIIAKVANYLRMLLLD